MILISSTRTRRGGSCLRDILCKTFHIYRTCMRRAPAGPVRARCVRVCCTALLPSKNMICVRSRSNGTPSEDFLHTSQRRLHILDFTSHTSSQLKPRFRTAHALTQPSSFKPQQQRGKKKHQNGGPARRTHEVPFIACRNSFT